MNWAVIVAAGLALGLGQPSSDDGLDRRVDIVNLLETPIEQLEAAPSGTGDWSGDLLARPIPSGGVQQVEIDDGNGSCRYDIRAVFESGEVIERQRINVCQISEFRYE